MQSQQVLTVDLSNMSRPIHHGGKSGSRRQQKGQMNRSDQPNQGGQGHFHHKKGVSTAANISGTFETSTG